MLEIAKIAASLLGGGLAGALLNEWFRRKRSRVQPIPLIERVNRLVSPELQGFALARVVGGSTGRRLEEVKNLREYQLTMRNSSAAHLQDAEVQFEFPADDVQAWASRPVLSKTALVQLNATATEPWRMAFRWRIPHLPSGDSVEFTFQAVNPSSEKFEAALYNSAGVVFERIVGEPPPQKAMFSAKLVPNLVISGVMLLALTITLWGIMTGRLQSSGEKLTAIKLAGCDLQVVSLFDIYGQHLSSSPWIIKHRIFNVGSQNCVIQSEKIGLVSPVTIKPGDILEKERFSDGAPKLFEVQVSLGAASMPPTSTTIPLYVER
ncbi:MAG TPA: hypothetical protein VHF01_08430 [Candidatus Acidoferrum sp.]|nr:hypothetical protein [Candidatus Acidoferrum sp.]